MKPIYKNILIGLGIAGAIGYYFASQKLTQLQNTFEKIIIKPIWVSKIDFSIKTAILKFNLDIAVINKSVDTFDISGFSLVKLTKVMVYYKNIFLGQSIVTINELSVPSDEQLTIKNIPIEVYAPTLLNNYLAFLNFSINDLRIVSVVEILGVEYQIDSTI